MEKRIDEETLNVLFDAMMAQIPDKKGQVVPERQAQLLHELGERTQGNEAINGFVNQAIAAKGNMPVVIFNLTLALHWYCGQYLDWVDVGFVSTQLLIVQDLAAGRNSYKDFLLKMTDDLPEDVEAHWKALKTAAACLVETEESPAQPLSALFMVIQAIKHLFLPPEEVYE